MCIHNHLNKSEFVRIHSFLLHLLEKLCHCLLMLLILHLLDAKMFNCMVPGAIGTISGFINPQARVIPMSEILCKS